MAKYTAVLGDDIQTPRRPSRAGLVIVLLALVVAAPLLYEGGLIVAGKWQAMLGTYIEVRTPVLDTLTDTWKSAHDEIRYRTAPYLRFKGMSPLAVVGAIAGLAILASLFLRRG